jgi:hypothetical protein
MRRLVLAASLTTSAAQARGGAPDVKVSGNRLVANGQTLQIRGVNFFGAELACVEPLYDDIREQYWAFPYDDAAVAKIASWGVNAVRVPLNESCWLGINPVKRTQEGIEPLSGSAAKSAGAQLRRDYRATVKQFVARLHAHGMIAILDLHWSAGGKAIAYAQWPVPDRDHSVDFWISLAKSFRNDRSVIFELFNEPFMPNAADLSWKCMRDGCSLPNGCADCGNDYRKQGCDARRCPSQEQPAGRYKTAGFQRLLDAVRKKAKAKNVVLVPGRYYSNDLGKWRKYAPRDPKHQLGATFHAYESLPCADEGCWDRDIAPIAAKYPVVATEFGPNTYEKTEPCDTTYDERWMDWADAHGVSYTAWAWGNLTGDYDEPRPKCSLGMNLADDVSPRPGHGQAVHDHLAARANASLAARALALWRA